MPVIGRLDRQVNDVLIDTVGRRPARDDRGDARSPDDSVPANDTGRANDPNVRARKDDDAKTLGRVEEELPVWLL